jgi:N-glycosylase/DNA lyase
LEGKKGNLEGTWRALVGHLVGRSEILKSLVSSGLTGKMASTWRVFGKSIYKDREEW